MHNYYIRLSIELDPLPQCNVNMRNSEGEGKGSLVFHNTIQDYQIAKYLTGNTSFTAIHFSMNTKVIY